MSHVSNPGAAINHAGEAHGDAATSKLSWLRAGVLGANDGVVSVAGLVMGVAGATTSRTAILVAGVAGIIAGSFSMAVGEYVSVSTQRDSEKAVLAKERWELEHLPAEELDELAALYELKGLNPDLARQVAIQLTEHDALGAHAETELGIDPEELANPYAAAAASFVAFALGALIPLLAVILPGTSARVIVTVVAVALALALTGYVSAQIGGAKIGPAVVRNVGGGLLAMAASFTIGNLVGGHM